MRQDTGAGSAPQAPVVWLKLLRWATVAAVVVVVFINVVAGIIPPLVVFVLLWLGGLFWLRRATKGPTILLLVAFIAFLLLSAPFIIPTLMVPASAGDFITNLLSVLAALVGIAAAVAVLRARRDEVSETPKKLALAAVGVAVAASVFSVIATTGYDDATPGEGDLQVVTKDLQFESRSLEVKAGEIGVFVSNADATLHTFTIEELDVDLAIPASKDARVTFDAEPGTYRFICVPHEGNDMDGTLTVE